jgi:hypothetical protein
MTEYMWYTSIVSDKNVGTTKEGNLAIVSASNPEDEGGGLKRRDKDDR